VNPYKRELAVGASQYIFTDELQSRASTLVRLFRAKETVISSLTIPKWQKFLQQGW